MGKRIFIGLALVAALSGCLDKKKVERVEAQREYDALYESCIYKVTGPFAAASIAIMRECAALAADGRSAPDRPK